LHFTHSVEEQTRNNSNFPVRGIFKNRREIIVNISAIRGRRLKTKVKMFPDDPIKEIIKELHPSLGRIVHPQDNDGLTEFDRQQIAAIENDKLFEILGRRTTRSFALFAIHLRDLNPELVEDIIQYTQEHVQQIHRSIQNYEKEQSLPSVTVGPSLVTNSSSNDLVQGCRATGNPPTLRTIFFQ
jgi:hypothetical protein